MLYHAGYQIMSTEERAAVKMHCAVVRSKGTCRIRCRFSGARARVAKGEPCTVLYYG
jgi:hypothetical protein